ncbi:polymorphic toxin-type HINT domain-containing protein [Streptomyces sp. NPDC006475]|uniref:polymorphic toxin-type HINT domain-containing protein n=1 Tax=Streptomyces sp. NPDC006475 TaxID=3155719 RepID=UPI0033B3F593
MPRIAAIAGFAMIPGLLTPMALAADPDPLRRPDLPTFKSAKVSPFTAKLDKKTATTRNRAAAADKAEIARASKDRGKTVTWPTAGESTLTLPATGTGTGTGTASAGRLPVTLSPPKPAAATSKTKRQVAAAVTVKVLDQKQASALGVKGIVLIATGPATGGSAELGINYHAFASAYGGDWAGRLQVTQLPACALTTPAAAKCRTRAPLEFTNQRKKNHLKTPLSFAPAAGSSTQRAAGTGESVVLAVAAGTKSGGGDYKATPLAASSNWEAGGSSGTFTWSYPLRVPPTAAGPKPALAISYDSGSVDGRTASTNNQGTAIGEGFDITSSYVERKYGSCDDDGQTDKFDLCWKYDNASLVLNGKATELVKDDTTGTWRLKNDDASTVTVSTGADNGDDNGERWTVTTGDGTKYFFGLNKLAGAGAGDRTNSVWTVPVFGDDAGEPGYADGTSFASRSKKQAWRWNLDYVEDTHGNAMSYWYTAETNHYDMLGDDNNGTAYTRGGYLEEIRYGQRAGALFSATPAASNKVTFGYAERCIATGTGCGSLTDETRDNWPDVPFDAECKADQKCTGSSGPSFYTRKRMTGIATQAWNAAATTPQYESVDAWALKQRYLDPGDTGDSTDQTLWLEEIRHTGKRGTDLTLDPITFDHESHPNRVDGTADDVLPLTKPRLKTITSETGALTTVSYLPADCLAGQSKPNLDTNTRRCYPVFWSPNGEKDPKLDWFHKYPVQSVATADTYGGSEAVQHTYTYSGGGAWHYNEDPLTKEKERTWSIWRGFEKVTHLTGLPGKTQSKTVTVYMRGMNGDRVLSADGKTPHPDQRKTATTDGVKAAAITDTDQYAGFTRESVTYNGAQEVSGAINDPWSKRTATQHKSYADTEAYFIRTAATHARTNITTSGTPRDRVRSTATTYDDYGMATSVEDKGDNTVSGDEKCTRTWYARNDALGINTLSARTRTVAKPCSTPDSALDLPADATRSGDVISDTAAAYDTTTWSATQVPTKGELTWTGRAKAYGSDDQPVWQKAATTAYDLMGRPLTVKDTNDTIITTTTYTPAASGPPTLTTTANAKGHTTKTHLDFATGTTLKVTDPNNNITESTYDALGRVSSVWLPNRLRLLQAPANYQYTYHLNATGMSWVSSATARGNGSGYNTTYEIYDSLLRPRQVQAPSPSGGSVISQSVYDERGLKVKASTDIWANDTTPSGNMVQIDGGQAPMETVTTYDGAERPLTTVTQSHNVPRWSTTTGYSGDTVTSSAPTGGQATAVVTNALGQTTERREYGGTQPAGDDFTKTTFTYTPAGQQKTVTGPDDTISSYGYDLLGRKTSASDPDKGTTTTAYNELDQAISSTETARSKTLVSEYDVLGRKTGLWDGSKTDATKLAAWTFDTLKKGQQDTAVRYDGGLSGKAYTNKVTLYDNLYQVTKSQLILPDSTKEPLVAAGVPQTLNFAASYNLDGTTASSTSPAVAGLPSEAVTNDYNFVGVGLQTTSKGLLQDGHYSPLGDPIRLDLATDVTSTRRLYLNYAYEIGTRRLQKSFVESDIHSGPLQDLAFTQDHAGNVTRIFDSSSVGSTGKIDNQCFTYDGHRRLIEAWTPKTADCDDTGRTTSNLDGAAPYWTSYTYNSAGQRKSETQHTPTGDKATDYTYGTTNNQPHPLAKTTGAKPATYGYDKAGNTTSRPGTQAQQTLAWNAEGKLAGTSEPAAGSKPALGNAYLYDAEGQLLIRRPTTTNGDTILYVGDTEVRLTTAGSTKALSGTRYYTAASQTIAVRTATPGTTGTKLNYLAGDHHGTSSLAIDATTLAPTKRYTTPFGSPRGTKPTAWPDDKEFLGKPADATTGLTHIGAREYDPGIGQFVSVDPIFASQQHQSLNGYSYANQNPTTTSDPTGLCVDPGNGHCMPTNGGDAGKNAPPEEYYKKGGSPGGSTGTASTDSGGNVGNGGGGGGNWFTGFFSGYKDEAVRFVGGTWETTKSEFTNIGDCFSGDGCTDALSDVWNRLPPGMISNTANGLVARGSEISSDVTEGRSDQGAAKVAFDVSLFFVTRKISAGGCPPGNSFTAGTLVAMADGRTLPIERIAVGDEVVATAADTGETIAKEVKATIVGAGQKDLVEITLDSGTAGTAHDGSITATDGHPFWVPSLKRWVAATDLRAGQWLRTSAGTHVQVTAVKRWTQHAAVYNLTVADIHTYYVVVGATSVLVHNCGGVLLNRAKTLHATRADKESTVAVARVRSTSNPDKVETWVATERTGLPDEWRGGNAPLRGERYMSGKGHAEATIMNRLGADWRIMGMASSTRMCPACFAQARGIGLTQSQIGRGDGVSSAGNTPWRVVLGGRG